MNVVITGSTKGIGKAFATKFLSLGDKVVITSRSEENLATSLNELNSQFPNLVFGKTSDVQSESSIIELIQFAQEKLGTIDIWVNNAGTAGLERHPLVEMPATEIHRIVETNIVGTLLCCKNIIPVMLKQGAGKIFNMEGMGSDGRTYANSLCYSTSKRAIPMIMKTLVLELKGTPVQINDISPGMVLTDLILKGGTNPLGFWKILNILAEKAETVANYLVPRMRNSIGSGKCINFLTTGKVIIRFMTANKRKNRLFDENTGKVLVDLK
jgi:chlorophyll(ide) b reductase